MVALQQAKQGRRKQGLNQQRLHSNMQLLDSSGQPLNA
jgi:hypothetical protein